MKLTDIIKTGGENIMKLNVLAFAITCSIFWGLSLFALTWWVIAFEGYKTYYNILTLIYRGYSMTPFGSMIGLIWGLADGLVGGAIFASLYNLTIKFIYKK